MNKILKKIFIGILISTLLLPSTVFAASDPAVTNLSVLPITHAATQEVDFVLTYGNSGSSTSGNVEVIIDYNENIFEKIKLGDSTNCEDTDFTVRCFYKDIAPNSKKTVSFKASVISTAKTGTKVITVGRIDEATNSNDDITNNYAKVTTTVSGLSASQVSATGLPAALISSSGSKLESPSTKQGVALFDVSKLAGWETSGLFTNGLKFMIRGKEALAWSLGIKDSGFHNSAIRDGYLKVLTIVNSLFIVGLLIIAAMWMFSILIPRKYLRKVILVYGMAVVFVNFALPLNQLFIDATGLLQKSLMSDVNITSIVEVPSYDDSKAVGYQNENNFLKESAKKKVSLNITDPTATTTTTTSTTGTTTTSTGSSIGSTTGSTIGIGTIEQDFLQPSYTGTISGTKSSETVQLFATTNDQEVKLNTNQAFELSDEVKFNPDQENSIFAFLMMLFTGLAYFGMAIIFILRIVILWALMIVSPVLFLLAIFHATRSYFINWLGVYARWLLIGPLLALGIGIVVGIWQAVGLPITSTYSGSSQFGILSNIGFYLPGKDTLNTLSTTPQMMEYLMFLIMLYLPILFAFMLTRQKLWSKAATAVAERREAAREREGVSVAGAEAQGAEKGKKEEGVAGEIKTLGRGFKGFLDTQIAKLTKTAMPASMRLPKREEGAPQIESATSFLPQHLALSSMHNMFDMISGEAKGSRNARKKAIEKLATAESIENKTERQQVMAVRQEIMDRASKGDGDAVRVLNEIRSAEGRTEARVGGMVELHAAAPTQTEVKVKIEKEEEKEGEKKIDVSTKAAPKEKGENDEGEDELEPITNTLRQEGEEEEDEQTEDKPKRKERKSRH